MRNFTKSTALILSIAMISFSSVTSFASEKVDSIPISIETNEITQPRAFFDSFTGTVKEITDGIEGSKTALVENKDGGQANFTISGDTYLVDNTTIAVGSEITGFYEPSEMMIMIYPPQYSIDIVAAVVEGQNIKADKFDADLLSADKTLKLNISEETEILWENGTAINWFAKPTPSDLEGVLSNRKLIVLYNFTTKSIPAQTTPIKVIVLSQQESDSIDDVSGSDIFVNGNKIVAPPVYTSETGVVMVPIRAISETLRYEVSWNSSLQSVMVGKSVSFILGEDNYIVSESNLIKLGTAPELKDGNTYVPLSFFKEVLLVNNSYFSEGKILIDTVITEK